MNLVQLIVPLIAAAAIAYASTPLAAALAWRIGAVDMPSARKMHTEPTPRLGGIAVVLALFATVGALLALRPDVKIPADLLFALTAGLLPILLVSAYDDVRSQPALVKLAAQLIGASIAVTAGLQLNETAHLFGQPIHLGVLTVPLSIVWIIGVTNAFNLVDGLDGLSAGLALISAGSLAIVATLTQSRETLVLSLIVVGALAGFIPYNLHPARVFLGDCGSTAIGFCLACLTLQGGAKLPAGLAVTVPLLVIGVPLADTLISILRRLVSGLREGTGIAIFRADREHIHHRLLRLGLDHRRVVLLLYGAGVVTAAVGVISLLTTASNVSLLLTTLLVGAAVGVSRLGYDEFVVVRAGAALKVYDTTVVRSGHFKLLVDIGLVIVAFWGAVALKYDDWGLVQHEAVWLEGVAILPAINLASFLGFGVYRRAWRFAAIRDVIGVNCAVALSSAVGFLIIRLLLDPQASITLFGLYAILHMIGTSMGRSSFRILRDLRDTARVDGRRVVIYGAGDRGRMALLEIWQNVSLGLVPIGFIDDQASLKGQRISGVRVLGGLAELARLIEQHRVDAVLVAADRMTPERLAMAMRICSANGVEAFQFVVRVDAITRRTHAEQPWSDSLIARLS